MPSHRTGLLIIRAWVEAGSAEPLRAQVRVTDDIAIGIERTFTLVQSDAAGELVDAWLQGILGAAAADPGSLTTTDSDAAVTPR
jgi:hypothetical protein